MSPDDELAVQAASAVRVARSALARAQAAVDEHPTRARLDERDRWAAELEQRRAAYTAMVSGVGS